MTGPRVVLDVPPGWRAGEVPAPKISESAGAELAQYAAFVAQDGSAAITIGCVATPVPGWVEDMRPAVEGRTVALAGASAALATGTPIDARSDGHGGFELRSVNDLEGPLVGTARTFLGFDAARVHTCFATCGQSGGHHDGGASCRSAIAGARLEGSGPPPAPGIPLAAVTWAVHHPGPFATWATVALIMAGILAIVVRRRPRTSVQ